MWVRGWGSILKYWGREVDKVFPEKVLTSEAYMRLDTGRYLGVFKNFFF